MKNIMFASIFSVLITIFINGCTDKQTSLATMSFKSLNTPTTDIEKKSVQYSQELSINGIVHKLNFNTIMKSGDVDNNEIFGLVKDYQDNPLKLNDGSNYICNGTNSGVGSGLDHSSILQKNSKIYMINQFECPIGALYMLELKQDKKTGILSAKKDTLKFISQKDEFGGYVHCAGQTTPWNSHLGSEEYESNARLIENFSGATGDKYYDETAKFWGNDFNKTNPYYYGWTPEVQIKTDGSAKYMKHYSMGRFSHELAYVMPDQKTVYLTDDGTNVGLFMFKSDYVQDLSSGTLYAAKLTQTSSDNGGKFNISWINLGHATDSEIRSFVAKKIKFSELFDSETVKADGSCPTGFTSINTTTGHECLSVKNRMQKIASRLETRRYAAIMGATTELRKEEGITYDEINKKLYLAMSSVERGMEDNTKYDIGGNNHIKVKHNYCGAVYELNVDNKLIATDMSTLIVGEPIKKDMAGNSCSLDKISNPDNVSMVQGTDILMIAEDSSKHTNNVVWAYNLKDKSLSRVITTPLDAEATSIFWHKNINGFSYMTAVTQHPMRNQNTTSSNKESSIAVLGPIKFK